MTAGPGWTLERSLWRLGCGTVGGVDEAGRGCLAGPVTAAVVILPPDPDLPYRDSKELSPEARSELAVRLAGEAVASGVGWATAEEIDSIGILQATHLAAGRALELLPDRFRQCGLVTDYLKLDHTGPVLPAARADRLSLQVAAASILAKTSRDEHLIRLDERHPGYGFARHKGYGTAVHLAALDRSGPCSEHRRSFAPVAVRLSPDPAELQCTDENRNERQSQDAASD